MSAAEAARRPARRRRARGAADSQGQRHAESSAQAPCALAGAPHCASTAASVRAQRVLLTHLDARPQPAAARSPQVARGTRSHQTTVLAHTQPVTHFTARALSRPAPESARAHPLAEQGKPLAVDRRPVVAVVLVVFSRQERQGSTLSLFLYRICACFSSLVGRRKTGAASACLCLACRLGRVAHV